MTATTTPATAKQLPQEDRLSSTAHTRRRAATVAAAVLASVAIWLLAVPLLGHDLRVSQAGGRPPVLVGLPAVIITAVVVSLAGWGLLAVLERWTGRARAVWTITATVVLALSFIPLLIGSDTATSTRVALGFMHLAVGAALIPNLPRRASAAGAGHA